MERPTIAIIGFGEAGQAFAEGMPAPPCAYDRKSGQADERAALRAAAERYGVRLADDNAEAVAGAALVLSLVTADEALAAARETARAIAPGALFCDLNSVAPDTKRAARDLIEATGGRYADVAVMSPVHPARRAAPLLVSGPHADAAAAALAAAGFSRVRAVPGEVGRASAIKMIRSVMVKGVEALTAECVLAADAAGVLDEVLASLDASPPPASWAERADYNLDRMLVHGLRRAAEMEEVVKTLDALGTGAAMSRGTVARQRAIGRRGLGGIDGLPAKLAALAEQEAMVGPAGLEPAT